MKTSYRFQILSARSQTKQTQIYLLGQGLRTKIIIQIKAMQKTKLISKDFIRDCRVARDRERRESTIYNLPPGEEEQVLPVPDCHTLFPQEDSYSIEDFILNLQAEQSLYYNDLDDHLCAPHGPSIEQINRQYEQRIAEQPPSGCPTSQKKDVKVSFGGELRAKYFREDEAPSAMGEREEYEYAMEEEENFSILQRFI